MPVESTKTINVRNSIGPAFKYAKLAWKLSGGKVCIYDHLGAVLHHVQLTADEETYLDNGGKLIIVHACGTEVHVKLPHYR